MCAEGYGVGKTAVFDKCDRMKESRQEGTETLRVTGQVVRSSDSCTGNKMLCFQSVKGSHSLKAAVLRGPFTS